MVRESGAHLLEDPAIAGKATAVGGIQKMAQRLGVMVEPVDSGIEYRDSARWDLLIEQQIQTFDPESGCPQWLLVVGEADLFHADTSAISGLEIPHDITPNRRTCIATGATLPVTEVTLMKMRSRDAIVKLIGQFARVTFAASVYVSRTDDDVPVALNLF
uniref:hypothetical protein n=1 Tax=Nocardia sp. TaxID=1821 RepID=UPI002588E8E0